LGKIKQHRIRDVKMNIPIGYVYGSDSMYLLLKTDSKVQAKNWVESFLSTRPKAGKFVRFILGLDTEVGTLRQTIKNNLYIQVIPNVGIVLEVDRCIAEEAGEELVQWLGGASATVKNSVDILTREQAAALGGSVNG
jgi:hypothetical protein